MSKTISVTKIFNFEMAHQLDTCFTEKCKSVHGHGYRAEVTLSGDLNEDGMVMDFGLLKEIVKPIIDIFDHNFLTTETFGGINPTSENIAQFLFDEIGKKTILLKKIKLWETEKSFVEIEW